MRIRRDRRRYERTIGPLLEALNQGRVRGAQSAPQTGARLSNWGSFGLRQARLRHHFRQWKMTYHDLNVKMGESGRVRLKWPGIAAGLPSIRRNATAAGFRPADASPGLRALNADLLTQEYGKRAGRLWAKSRYRDRQDALIAHFEVAFLESRPEGAATCQPRAPPWELDRVLRIATP